MSGKLKSIVPFKSRLVYFYAVILVICAVFTFKVCGYSSFNRGMVISVIFMVCCIAFAEFVVGAVLMLIMGCKRYYMPADADAEKICGVLSYYGFKADCAADGKNIRLSIGLRRYNLALTDQALTVMPIMSFYRFALRDIAAITAVVQNELICNYTDTDKIKTRNMPIGNIHKAVRLVLYPFVFLGVLFFVAMMLGIVAADRRVENLRKNIVSEPILVDDSFSEYRPYIVYMLFPDGVKEAVDEVCYFQKQLVDGDNRVALVCLWAENSGNKMICHKYIFNYDINNNVFAGVVCDDANVDVSSAFESIIAAYNNGTYNGDVKEQCAFLYNIFNAEMDNNFVFECMGMWRKTDYRFEVYSCSIDGDNIYKNLYGRYVCNKNKNKVVINEYS